MISVFQFAKRCLACSALLALGADRWLQSAHAQAPPPQTAPADNPWHTPDSAFIGGQVLVKATIRDSQPAWFLLDTGSPITIIDESLATAAKLDVASTRPRNAKGEEGGAVRIATDVPIRLGDTDFTPRQLRVGKLDARFSKFLGRPIAGVLGAAFFTQYVVQFDYHAQHVRFRPTAGFVHDDKATIFPMGIVSGLPVVLVTATPVGAQPVGMLLLLDTGLHGAISIDPHWAAAQGMPAPGQKARLTEQMTPEESSEGTTFRLAELSLGGFTFKDVPATTGDHPIYRTVGAVGVLGSEVLSRFNITFDYLRQRMILEPNENRDDPFEGTLSGFGVRLEGGTYDILRIDGVDDQSPASQAGMKAGDILLAVGGRSTGEFAAAQLGDVLRASLGKPLPIRVLRSDRPVELTLVPQVYD